MGRLDRLVAPGCGVVAFERVEDISITLPHSVAMPNDRDSLYRAYQLVLAGLSAHYIATGSHDASSLIQC